MIDLHLTPEGIAYGNQRCEYCLHRRWAHLNGPCNETVVREGGREGNWTEKCGCERFKESSLK